MTEPKLQSLEISTILSNITKQGKVNLAIDGKVIAQWDIAKAREIHRMLGECIETAIADTMIYTYLREHIGLSEEKASRALLDFREIRQGGKDAVFLQ